MAIVKMKLVNIVGLLGEFDRVIEEYIIDHDIHLEDAVLNLTNVKGLHHFDDYNPYDGIMKQFSDVMQMTGKEIPFDQSARKERPLEDLQKESDVYLRKIIGLVNRKREIESEIEERKQIMNQLRPLGDLDIDVERFFNLEYVKFRFGRLPRAGYIKLKTYLTDLNTLFIESSEDADSIWGMYFAPAKHVDKIDSIFSSLYFERIRISDKVEGSPAQALEQSTQLIRELHEELLRVQFRTQELMNSGTQLYSTVKFRYESFNVRKYAAHTDESFYIMGWMEKSEAERLVDLLEQDTYIVGVIEEPEMVQNIKPPTVMKNPRIFKPFESFVTMYGLPAYNEIDPTVFMAITYVLMFGSMFGDMGHGLVLGIVGFLMAKKKGMPLGKILILAGVTSMFFGFLYGSIFGNETIIRHYLIHPMANGNSMNTLLILSVGVGIVLILMAMVLNVINGVKSKNWGRIFFGQNGVAGIIFYIAAVIAALAVFSGKSILSPLFIIVCFVIPLLLIFFQEPLGRLAARKHDWMPHKKGEFVLETFFEVFEVLLSFITNTISFVRVGAFALNHAGMMMVVMTFFESMKGASSILIFVFGNILVIALEGLIVGIQVLRLEFYELFSRFFTGDGKRFEPVFSNKQKEIL